MESREDICLARLTQTGPTNRGWTRDFGPIFVRGDNGLAIARFHFNAWAKYKDWKKDDKTPSARRSGSSFR